MIKLVVFDVSGTLLGGYDQIYDGIKELWAELKVRNIQIAVATQLSRSGLNQCLDEFGWREDVSAHKSADETSYKPNPEMINEILLETGVEKNETIMVGDAPSDIHMAHNAGVLSAYATWGTGVNQMCLNAHPHYVLETPLELLDILCTTEEKKGEDQ